MHATTSFVSLCDWSGRKASCGYEVKDNAKDIIHCVSEHGRKTETKFTAEAGKRIGNCSHFVWWYNCFPTVVMTSCATRVVFFTSGLQVIGGYLDRHLLFTHPFHIDANDITALLRSGGESKPDFRRLACRERGLKRCQFIWRWGLMPPEAQGFNWSVN